MIKFDEFKGKKVLVTGHTGFKGSWLSLWLSELGADVIGYALKPDSEPSLFNELGLQSRIKNMIGDIRDYDLIKSVVDKNQPEYVFHLAAQPLVQRSYKEPRLTYETNVMGTINLLESIRQVNSVRACVIVTSDKCYENKEWIYGYREIDPLGGYDPYSSSKACTELVVKAYQNSYFNPSKYGSDHTTNIASVRAGNVIGGGDWSKDRLLTDCVLSLSQKRPINIRNPTATRPWQYVLEPLTGYLMLALHIHESPNFTGAWNFGPDDDSVIQVQDLVELIIKNWGSGSYNFEDNNFAHEASLLKLDSSKARNYLGWRPKYSIENAIRKTIEWYKSYYNGVRGQELYELTLSEIKNFSREENNDTI